MIPNEELILHNDCCKPKKSSGEKCHFYVGCRMEFLQLWSLQLYSCARKVRFNCEIS